MPRSKNHQRPLAAFGALAGVLALAGIGGSILHGQKGIPERSIEFNESVTLTVPKGSGRVRIWIPVPADDADQRTEVLAVRSPYPYRVTRETAFGNRLLYVEAEPLPRDGAIEIRTAYKIVRKEQGGSGRAGKTRGPEAAPALADYLKPRGLEIVSEKIGRISLETTKGLQDPMEKARALYEYVLRHMKYDKTGTGWGRGDPIYACDAGKGNCTDFHSLFIALARASRIPARFRMGIPLPRDPEGAPSGSYHCWAEFHVEGRGWIPVDISEAWKNPKKAGYFFGHLDADRILLSTGRELELSPKQKGAPLNYLSGPYIEIDGKPLNDFKLERRFRNI